MGVQEFEVENDRVIELTKPIFYGMVFLAGLSLNISLPFAGTLLGLAVLALISLVSAGLAGSVEDDWSRFLELISIFSLLLVVVFTAYTSALLSMR